MALDPGNARALFTLAETLEQLGRPAEAAERYRAILELERQQADAEAKQALFKEAVYLGIQPEEFTGS